MTTPLTISFVIPIYKIERIRNHFDELVQSLLTQTYPHTEIIFVNDASPDNSADIIQELADQHPRIRILTHSHNQGQGSARNTGATAATGDYIWFVDQDDLVSSNACQILADEAQSHSLPDIIRVHIAFTDKERLSSHTASPTVFVHLGDYHKSKQHRIDINYFLLRYYSGIPTPWCQIAKTELVRSYQFPGFSHEDVVHTFAMIMRANSLAYVHARLYFWRQHDLNAHKTRDFDEAVSGYVKALQITQELARQFSDRQALQRYTRLFTAHQRMLCLREALYVAKYHQLSKDLKVDITKRLRPKTWRAKLCFIRDMGYHDLYIERYTLLTSMLGSKPACYTYCYQMAKAFARAVTIKVPSLFLFIVLPSTYYRLQTIYAGFRKVMCLNP